MSESLQKNDEDILQHIRISKLTLAFQDPEIQKLFEKTQRSRWPKHTQSIVSLALFVIVLIYIPYQRIESSSSYVNLIFQVIFTLISLSFFHKYLHSYKRKGIIILMQTIHFFLYFIFQIIPSLPREVHGETSISGNYILRAIICTNTGISLIIVMLIIQVFLQTWQERAIILWTISLSDQFKADITSNFHFLLQMIILLFIYTVIIYLQEKYKRQKFFISFWQYNLLSEWKDIWKNTIPTPIIILGMSREEQSNQNQNPLKNCTYKRNSHFRETTANQIDQLQILIENPKEKDLPYPLIQEENHYNMMQASAQNNQQTSIRQKNTTIHGQSMEMNDLKLVVNGIEQHTEVTPKEGDLKEEYSHRIQMNQLLNSEANKKESGEHEKTGEKHLKQKQKLSEECKRADILIVKSTSEITMNRNKTHTQMNSVLVEKKDEDNQNQKETIEQSDDKTKENYQINLHTPFGENNFMTPSMNFNILPLLHFKEANKQFYSTFNLDEKLTNFTHQSDLKTIFGDIKDAHNTSLYNILQELINQSGQEFQRKSFNSFKNSELKTFNHLVYKDKYFEAKLIECDRADVDRTFMIILNDITEKVVNEQKKQQYLYKDQILAIATHDLKTPLNNIVCSVDSMKYRQDNQSITEQLELVAVSVKQMTNIIRDILDYSAINKGSLRLNIETFRLQDLIKQIFQLFKLDAQQRNIELKYTIDTSLQQQDITSDPSRLVQIFNNLIANSLKFTLKGNIHIKFKAKQHQHNIIHISIKDTGVGIPQQYVDQIFKPFQTFDHTEGLKTQGVGLGLIICKTLVRLLGPSQQRIGLKTKEKIGSKICFDFYQNIDLKLHPLPIRKNTGNSETDVKHHLLSREREKKLTIYSSPQKQSCEALLLNQNTDRSQKSPIINWKKDMPLNKISVIKNISTKEEQNGEIDIKNTQKEVSTPLKRINQLKINEKQDSSCVIKDYLEQEPVVQLVKIKQPTSSINLFTQISLPSQGDFGINTIPDLQVTHNHFHLTQLENPPSINQKINPKYNQFNFQQINTIEPLSTQVNISSNGGINSTNFASQSNIAQSVQTVGKVLISEQGIQHLPISIDANNKNQDMEYFIDNPYQQHEQFGQQKQYQKNSQFIDNLQKDAQYQHQHQHQHQRTPKNCTFQNKQPTTTITVHSNNNLNFSGGNILNQNQRIYSQNNITAYQNNSQNNINQSNNVGNQYSPNSSNNEIGNSSPYNNNQQTVNIPNQNHLSKFYTGHTPINSKRNLIPTSQSLSQSSTPQRHKFKNGTVNLGSSNSAFNTQLGTFSSMINQNMQSQTIHSQSQNLIKLNNQFNCNSQNMIQQKTYSQTQNYITPVLGEVNEEVNDSIHNSSGQNNSIRIINVLIVDDQSINQLILATLLKNLLKTIQFNIEPAMNGQDALDRIHKNPHQYYDMAFVDSNMPYMDGKTFIQRVRQLEEQGQISRIFLIGYSACAEEEERALFYQFGADGYIQKPVQSDLLQECIQSYFLSKSNQ